MERIGSFLSRKREYRKNHLHNSSFLNHLANLTTDDGSLYSADYSVRISPHYRGIGYKIDYSLSVCKSPNFHTWCRPDVPPSTCLDPTAYAERHWLSLYRSQYRIGDSEFPLQIAEALGRMPGLVQVRFFLHNVRYNGSVELDYTERLVPVFLEAICSPRSSSKVKRIVIRSEGAVPNGRWLGEFDFLTLAEAIPGLEMLDVVNHPSYRSKLYDVERIAKRLGLFLRTNKSLKSLCLGEFCGLSWAQILSALEILTVSRINALGSTEQEQLDGNMALEKLQLTVGLDWGVDFTAHEVMSIMEMVMDNADLKFAVGEFSLSIMASQCQLIMRVKHGVLVELDIPICDEVRDATLVAVVLRLNRGPSVLSLGSLPPYVVRKILSPLISNQRGQQANTYVTTLRLLGYRTEEDLEEVAYMMETNSTVEHLVVTNPWQMDSYVKHSVHYGRSMYIHDSPNPEWSRNVARLRERLRPGGTLRSFTFFGMELHKCPNPTASVTAGTSWSPA